jgi:hypothetical protein
MHPSHGHGHESPAGRFFIVIGSSMTTGGEEKKDEHTDQPEGSNTRTTQQTNIKQLRKEITND